jgi:hypothetical protein
MEIASNSAKVKIMAYFDRDDNFLVWLAEPLPDEVWTASGNYLLGTSRNQEAEVAEAEPVCGYIIQDWFGPFLFGPVARVMRGNC